VLQREIVKSFDLDTFDDVIISIKRRKEIRERERKRERDDVSRRETKTTAR